MDIRKSGFLWRQKFKKFIFRQKKLLCTTSIWSIYEMNSHHEFSDSVMIKDLQCIERAGYSRAQCWDFVRIGYYRFSVPPLTKISKTTKYNIYTVSYTFCDLKSEDWRSWNFATKEMFLNFRVDLKFLKSRTESQNVRNTRLRNMLWSKIALSHSPSLLLFCGKGMMGLTL